MRDGSLQVIVPSRPNQGTGPHNGTCVIHKPADLNGVKSHDTNAQQRPTRTEVPDLAAGSNSDLALNFVPDINSEDESEESSGSETDLSTDLLHKRATVQNQEWTRKACRRLQRVRSIPAQINPRAYKVLHGPVHVDHRKRKLIIHLDIRNTILVADSITNVSVEEALNSFLTSVTWGSEDGGEWVWHSDIPSLKSPAPGLKTFYKYLESKLVKNPEDRVNLRLQTGDFAHSQIGRRFQKEFYIHLARLAWQYDSGTSRDKVLTMSGRDGTPYHYILPAVYKLLQHLNAQRRDFAIVIRTYGRDAPNVLSSLKYGLQGNHPAFPEPLRLRVHKTPGLIKRITCNTFELNTYKSGDGVNGGCSEINQLLSHERDMYRFMCDSQGITGYVDDFYFWQGHYYEHTAGKPMWIDPSDMRHHHIFFDDNFRADDEDSIIDVRMFRKNAAEAQSVGLTDVARLENACLVQADLLESIADDDYFLRMVQECEKKYSHLLWSGQL